MPPWSVTMHPRKSAAAALPEAEPAAAFSSGAEPQAASASAATAPTASKRVFIRSPYPIDEAPIRRQTTSGHDFTRATREAPDHRARGAGHDSITIPRRTVPHGSRRRSCAREPIRAAGSPAQNTSCGTYSPHTSRSAVLTSPTVARALRASFIGYRTFSEPRAASRTASSSALMSPRSARSFVQARPLLGLDRRVDPQRLVGLVGVDRELVDTHDHALAGVDLVGDPVGRALDLGLLEPVLDRGDGTAELGHLVHQLAARLPRRRRSATRSAYEPANGSTVLHTSDS